MFNNIVPITPQDLSGFPDQASYKLNRMQDCIQNMWTAIYPVGSYYETSDSDFDPVKVWGGDWEEVSIGRWHRVA